MVNCLVNESIQKSLEDAIKKYSGGAIVMAELPADEYIEACIASVKYLVENGYEGIYISFQRPFKNISNLLKAGGVDMSKLFFVDVASASSDERGEKDPRCIHVSDSLDIDEIVRSIYTTLPILKGEKKFIFIDSMTTIALLEPLSETMRFSEFLIRTIKKHEVDHVLLVFNVAKDFAQKKFIKDIAIHVDDIITVVP